MTTTRQWRAWEACIIGGLSQAKAAARFGVSQQAISSRIRRYRQRTCARFGAALSARGRKVVLRPVQLSFISNT